MVIEAADMADGSGGKFTFFLVWMKRTFPWLWRITESVNSCIFSVLYPRTGKIAGKIAGERGGDGWNFSLVSKEDLEDLEVFLNSLPEESLKWFDPHGFDHKTLKRLCGQNAFVMMKATGEIDGKEGIAAYFFLRCFFVGKAFAGLVVDPRCQGQGLGSSIWSLCSEICRDGSLRMFATIADENKASLESCRKGTEVLSVNRNGDGYLLVECQSNNSR